ncbi:MAG: HU family DNA-binding protein [Clostridiales bacterium]|nr:HU family DNA-binding protein [Clostridiales bacterium]MBQ2817517.1 HU family DNA-binding protein [Clostridia bacterium]MBQ4637658.1 HU family DNA-binding protein [Clostridia bacterium]
MNKNELIAIMAEKCNMSKKDAEQALSAVTSTICEELARGGKVQIVGFGSFEVKHRVAHKGHNPVTKEPMTIPASNTPFFKAGKILKESVK